MKSNIIVFCFIILVFGQNEIFAKEYCQPMPKAEKEGDPWYMPESTFTKKNANKAAKELENQINSGVEGQDFLIDNELVMIKGYLYLAYLAAHKKEFGKEDVYLKKDFCRFLKEEAYVSH